MENGNGNGNGKWKVENGKWGKKMAQSVWQSR